MNVVVRNRNHVNFTLPQGLTFTVERYRTQAMGGHQWAVVAVQGEQLALWRLLAWLRYSIEIQDERGEALWWGYVSAVSLAAGGVSVGVDLATMANRIAVIWSNEEGGGITDWAEDVDSIANYGTKELLLAVDGVPETGAEQRRDWELSRRRFPTPVTRPGERQTGAGLLHCRGWFEAMDWTYYDRDEGLVEFLPGGGVGQKVGWGFTSSEVGFTARHKAISQLFHRLNTLDKGEKIAITGSSSNDGAYTLESSSERERQTYTASSIAFLQQKKTATAEYMRASHDVARVLGNPNIQSSTVVVTNEGATVTYAETTDYTIDYTDGTLTALSTGAIANNQVLKVSYEYIENRIEDANIGLGIGNAGDIVKISGSSANNGYFRVLSSGADGDRLTVKEAVTDEAPGSSVTVARGSNVSVEEALTDELPGASVTVTAYGLQAAQQFVVSSDDDWTVNQVAVNARKVGSPSDDLRISIRSDSSGTPGTILESADVPASSLSTRTARVVAQFLNTLSLTAGGTYWISVGRSGTADSFNYYEVAIDEDLGYASGELQLRDGAAWQDRPTDGDMPFQVLGSEVTTTQIGALAMQEGQFLSGVDIEDVSGLSTNQYRDGRTTAKRELVDLLEMGTTNERRLLASVTRARILHIVEEPAQPVTANYELTLAGEVAHRITGALARGDMRFVGQWVALRDLPGTADFSYINAPSPFLVEAAEYDAADRRYTIEPAGGLPVWRVGMSIDEG